MLGNYVRHFPHKFANSMVNPASGDLLHMPYFKSVFYSAGDSLVLSHMKTRRSLPVMMSFSWFGFFGQNFNFSYDWHISYNLYLLKNRELLHVFYIITSWDFSSHTLLFLNQIWQIFIEIKDIYFSQIIILFSLFPVSPFY